MKVEVEASRIVALETQANQLAQWLTIALSKRKPKTLTITAADIDATLGATVSSEVTDGVLKLTYQAP